MLNEVATATPEESCYLQYDYSYRPGSGPWGSKVMDTIPRAKPWIV